jgi:hypothetical protein
VSKLCTTCIHRDVGMKNYPCDRCFGTRDKPAWASAASCRCRELRKLLEQIMPPKDTGGDWWCPTCKEIVGGYHVTHQECHEACGTFLGDCQPGDKWEAIRKELEAK